MGIPSGHEAQSQSGPQPRALIATSHVFRKWRKGSVLNWKIFCNVARWVVKSLLCFLCHRWHILNLSSLACVFWIAVSKQGFLDIIWHNWGWGPSSPFLRNNYREDKVCLWWQAHKQLLKGKNRQGCAFQHPYTPTGVGVRGWMKKMGSQAVARLMCSP